MDGEFPEAFKCRSCLNIPENDIYGCENGHTICDRCKKSIENCPRCRDLVGTPLIRKKQLEKFFDTGKFDCSYKHKGCDAKVTRQETTSHSEKCSFGGTTVTLCKYLGYACSNEVNTRKLQEALQHFKQEHQCIFINKEFLEIKLNNFDNIDRNQRCLWKPIIVDALGYHYMLVICAVKSNLFCVCILIGEQPADKVQVKYRIKAGADRTYLIEWTTKPTSQNESELILNFPPYQFPLTLLKQKYIVQSDLTIQVHLSDSNFETNPERAYLTVDSIVQQLAASADQSTQLSWQQYEISYQELSNAIKICFNKPFQSKTKCNVCETSGLSGLRFKCLQCSDFDLCISCMENFEHSFHHFAIICTSEQEESVRTILNMNEEKTTFVDLPQESCNWSVYGSTLSDAKEIACQKCNKQPDYICLQCQGPFGACKSCFVTEMQNHYPEHFFAVATSNAAREFVLFILRKQNILPRLMHELPV